MKTFQVNEGSVSCNVMDEEAVVIHIDTSNYFSMNQTGTYLWSLLTERYCSSDELVRAISSGYAQEVDSARNEVDAFLDKLTEADLVLVQPDSEPSDQGLASLSPLSEPYEPPDLVRFGNLETLILSGE